MGKTYGSPSQLKAAVENKIDELEFGVTSATSRSASATVDGAENISVKQCKSKLDDYHEVVSDSSCVTC